MFVGDTNGLAGSSNKCACRYTDARSRSSCLTLMREQRHRICLSMGPEHYIHNKYSQLSRLFDQTAEYMTIGLYTCRVTPGQTARHCITGRLGGIVAVSYLMDLKNQLQRLGVNSTDVHSIVTTWSDIGQKSPFKTGGRAVKNMYEPTPINCRSHCPRKGLGTRTGGGYSLLR